MIFLGSAVVALMTFLIVLLLVSYARYVKRKDLFARLERYNIHSRHGEISEEAKKSFAERFKNFLTRSAAPLANFTPIQLLDIKMRQAGIPLLGGEFLVGVFLVAVITTFGVWMLTLDRLIAGLAGVLAAAILWGIISFRIGRRKQIFIAQLGDALTTISNALRAGYSFQQSMDAVAKEMEPPISEEFFQVTREVSMGMPLETSLEAMNKRMDSSDFALVVTAVIIQREVGGNLAQILDTISDTISERIRMKREMFTLTAQGRLSATVIFVLPFAIGIFMYCIQPSQIMILFENPFGRIALGVSFLLELIGVFVIQKILNVEV